MIARLRTVAARTTIVYHAASNIATAALLIMLVACLIMLGVALSWVFVLGYAIMLVILAMLDWIERATRYRDPR